VSEGVGMLAEGEFSPDGFIVAMTRWDEFDGKRAPLVRLYWAFFLRAPDKSGLDYWVGKLNAGKKLAAVASQFAQSSEFQTKYGSASNAKFVTLVYENVLEREPDAAGLAYWVTRLDAGTKTRGDVMTNFSESGEGKRFLAPQVDMILIHLGMFQKMISDFTLKFQLGGIKGTWVPELYAAGIRQSDTYATRITP
jgi:hypothetical protein